MNAKVSMPQFSNFRGEWVYFWNDQEISGFETALEARQDQLERLRQLAEWEEVIEDERY